MEADSNLRALFVARGISFPPGASLRTDPMTHQLCVLNTRSNHELLEQLLYQTGCLPMLVEVEAELLRAPREEFRATAGDPREQFRHIASRRIQLVDRLSAVSMSGSQLQIANNLALTDFPELRRWQSTTNQTATPLLGQFLGSILTATPTIGGNNQEIALTLIWEHKTLLGCAPTATGKEALTDEKSLQTSLVLWNGQSAIYCLTNPTDSYGAQRPRTDIAGVYFLRITARLVTLDGRTIPAAQPR